MDRSARAAGAQLFLDLHHAPRLLVLPNIWNPLGARMLEGLGYPAVATASAAVANSLGYDDGERLRFGVMLDAIRSIADAVTIPLTADIESGYASNFDQLAENVGSVLRAGAVGINLEDSLPGSGALRPVAEQCRRLIAARQAADAEGIHLVINARIDTFVTDSTASRKDRITETIERGCAYREAGADCLYPIGPGDVETLSTILEGTPGPLNVFARHGTAPMHELKSAGISRLSLGPHLLRAAFTTVRNVARQLLEEGSYEPFTKDVMTSEQMNEYVSHEKMPGSP